MKVCWLIYKIILKSRIKKNWFNAPPKTNKQQDGCKK
jgi:hypothetical protein